MTAAAPDLATISEEAHELPSDMYLLPEHQLRLLEPGHAPLWNGMNQEGRKRLLLRLEKQEAKRERDRLARERRQQLSQEYVTALCSLPKPSDPAYPAAWEEFLAKKAAYFAAKRG